jgi:hypothetical protein
MEIDIIEQRRFTRKSPADLLYVEFRLTGSEQAGDLEIHKPKPVADSDKPQYTHQLLEEFIANRRTYLTRAAAQANVLSQRLHARGATTIRFWESLALGVALPKKMLETCFLKKHV